MTYSIDYQQVTEGRAYARADARSANIVFNSDHGLPLILGAGDEVNLPTTAPSRKLSRRSTMMAAVGFSGSLRGC